MLDNPRMTNSTFSEGYSTDGALKYAPYSNDPRISRAHGWSTGPSSVLSFNVAGIVVVRNGGAEWKIAPRLSDLTSFDAGYTTSVGFFGARSEVGGAGQISVEFEAPQGTKGALSLEYPRCSGNLTLKEVSGTPGCQDVTLEIRGDEDSTGAIDLEGLNGGKWEARFACE